MINVRSLKTLLSAAALSSAALSTAAFTAAPVAPNAAAIYSAKCAKCHGPDGRGVEKYKKKGVKDFTDAKWQKTRSDAQLSKSIANGKGDVMPAWSAKLSAEEIKALVALVRSWAKG
jgi:cytochrome c oxidase cbb3-type subunit 3